MIEYKLFEKTLNLNTNESYISYGITVLKNNEIIKTVTDICTNKTQISKLINKFNTLKLELCHLDIAIEDFLYDQSAD